MCQDAIEKLKAHFIRFADFADMRAMTSLGTPAQPFSWRNNVHTALKVVLPDATQDNETYILGDGFNEMVDYAVSLELVILQ